jgi:hypothetical protein
MKQQKIAISLGIVAALAAPFVLRTYKMEPTSLVLVPLTAREKERIAGYLKETNNCQTLTDRKEEQNKLIPKPPEFIRTDEELAAEKNRIEKLAAYSAAVEQEGHCLTDQLYFQRGGIYAQHPDYFKYMLFNSAAVITGFVIIFALTFLLPALARRYWRWLNT